MTILELCLTTAWVGILTPVKKRDSLEVGIGLLGLGSAGRAYLGPGEYG